MGSSPSKRKSHSEPGIHPHLVLLVKKETGDKATVEVCKNSEVRKENEQLSTEEHLVQEAAPCSSVHNQNESTTPEGFAKIVEEFPDQQTQKKDQQTQKKTEKMKKTKEQGFPNKKPFPFHRKVDFPPQMVRAHWAAYTFLNPNISKLETLLGLLDQAAQTKLSLQPMVSSLLFLFEEINQALEEMAEEGEILLKEHEEFLTLPSGMMDPGVSSTRASSDQINTCDTPPDLLQELLNHSTKKMRHLGNSVQALSDTTLEDAAKYFSSISNLLLEKALTKQAAEQRMTRVVAKVELAIVKKPHPEDSTLHSEDSGIGGENDSLTGKEKLSHHRGRAGSFGSRTHLQDATDHPTIKSPRLHQKEDEGDLDEDKNYKTRLGRRRSNSLPPHLNQAFFSMQLKCTEDQQHDDNIQSTKTSNILAQFKMIHENIDERMKDNELQKNVEFQNPVYCTNSRRYSFHGLRAEQMVLVQKSQPSFSFSMLTPRPPKRETVKRLINTFSQGSEVRSENCHPSNSPCIIKPKTSGVFLPTDRDAGELTTNAIKLPVGREEMDADNLPPPPPEVLMDKSFQGNSNLRGNREPSQMLSGLNLPIPNHNTRSSNRLKASMQNIDVLPNRTSVRSRLTPISFVHPVRQDVVMETQGTVLQESCLNVKEETFKSLYQQTHKINILHNVLEHPNKTNLIDILNNDLLSHHTSVDQVNKSNQLYERGSSCHFPVIAPPVSRVRLPPPGPSVCHRFPSPPLIRTKSASQASSHNCSPKTVVRATEKSLKEFVPSVSFRDARSVFCQNETRPSEVLGNSAFPLETV